MSKRRQDDVHQVLTVGTGSQMLIFSLGRSGDRFQQEISRSDGSTLTSIDSASPWETPVYTERHFQDDTCFLSGTSQHGHWSVSVECSNDESFLFDAACRLKSPAKIASIYKAFKNGVTINQVADGEAPTSLLREVDAWMVCVDSEPEAYPTTVRWKYRIELAG